MRAFYVLLLSLAPALVSAQQRPRFQDYPATGRYTGRTAVPRLRPGTAAWHFRTRIREAARGRPTFAGHYILARWGCGAECLSSAIIDANTGAVYLIDFTTCCWFDGAAAKEVAPATGEEPIAFRLTSRLLVFEGLLSEAGRKGPHYFKFERGRLVALP